MIDDLYAAGIEVRFNQQQGKCMAMADFSAEIQLAISGGNLGFRFNESKRETRRAQRLAQRNVAIRSRPSLSSDFYRILSHVFHKMQSIFACMCIVECM